MDACGLSGLYVYTKTSQDIAGDRQELQLSKLPVYLSLNGLQATLTELVLSLKHQTHASAACLELFTLQAQRVSRQVAVVFIGSYPAVGSQSVAQPPSKMD